MFIFSFFSFVLFSFFFSLGVPVLETHNNNGPFYHGPHGEPYGGPPTYPSPQATPYPIPTPATVTVVKINNEIIFDIEKENKIINVKILFEILNESEMGNGIKEKEREFEFEGVFNTPQTPRPQILIIME